MGRKQVFWGAPGTIRKTSKLVREVKQTSLRIRSLERLSKVSKCFKTLGQIESQVTVNSHSPNESDSERSQWQSQVTQTNS